MRSQGESGSEVDYGVPGDRLGATGPSPDASAESGVEQPITIQGRCATVRRGTEERMSQGKVTGTVQEAARHEPVAENPDNQTAARANHRARIRESQEPRHEPVAENPDNQTTARVH